MMNTMMKKIAIAFAAAAMVLASMTCIASAHQNPDPQALHLNVQEISGTKTCISENGASIRNIPSTKGIVLGNVDNNDQISINGYTTNGWYRVSVADPVSGDITYGFVASNLFADELGGTNVYDSKYGIENAANKATKSTYTTEGTAGTLTLRSNPTFDYNNSICNLPNGTEVRPVNMHQPATYWYVYVPSMNVYGFVNSNYLK